MDTQLLKKIGIPATLAAVISSLVVTVPLLFRIDERYAKDERLDTEIKKLEERNERLQKELAQVVGYQQAMLTLLHDLSSRQIQANTRHLQVERAIVAPQPSPPVALPVPQPAPPAPEEAASKPLATKSEKIQPIKPAPPLSVQIKPDLVNKGEAAKKPTDIERPKNFKDLSEGLERQQRRLAPSPP